jgi:hypothetical protein
MSTSRCGREFSPTAPPAAVVLLQCVTLPVSAPDPANASNLNWVNVILVSVVGRALVLVPNHRQLAAGGVPGASDHRQAETGVPDRIVLAYKAPEVTDSRPHHRLPLSARTTCFKGMA